MRTRTPVSKLALVATLAFALTPSVMSMAATKAGRIDLIDPVSRSAYSATVPFAWDFTPGKKVRTTSSLYFQASSDRYRWKTIDTRIPIRHGAYMWDTTDWAEGTYHVRSVVHKTFVTDQVGPIVVDRTDPIAQITQPSEGDVIIEDLLTVSSSVVAGTTTLEVDAFDFGSGVGQVVWDLDGTEIGQGSSLEYNFSLEPGPHTLTVTVSDEASNVTTDSVELIALPGPSILVGEAPEVPAPGEGGEDPSLPDGIDPDDVTALVEWVLGDEFDPTTIDPLMVLAMIFGEDFDPATLPDGIDPLEVLGAILGEDFPPSDPTGDLPPAPDPGTDPTSGLPDPTTGLPDPSTDPTSLLPEEIDDPTSIL